MADYGVGFFPICIQCGTGKGPDKCLSKHGAELLFRPESLPCESRGAHAWLCSRSLHGSMWLRNGTEAPGV